MNLFPTIAVLVSAFIAGSQQCGTPQIQPYTGSNYAAEEDRIIGGRQANAHSWPWQVSLRNNNGHFCGGSLVNSQWIVTAAHCLVNVFSLNVRMGDHNLHSVDTGETTIQSAGVYIHPSYDRFSSAHDIAMVKLSRPVQYSRTIQPVCLPTQGASLGAGQNVYVTGWGNTRTGQGNFASPTLKQVMVPVVDLNRCSQMSPRPVSPYSICTGFSTGGHNPCFGDSGGPLVFPQGNAWYLHGVVSWGPQICAIRTEPAIFVRVSSYLPWIQSTMNRF